jgi:adenylosuccinate synthase
MPVTVIVGGQFGSEGKGKVADYFAREQHATIAIRVGGSNSGHTVIEKTGTARVFRVLPTPSLIDHVVCVLGAGTYIDVEVLLSEVKVARLPADRLLIDPNAYVISEVHKRIESTSGLGDRIGSTQSGTGAAVLDRIARRSSSSLAQNDPRLKKFIRPVTSFLRAALNREEPIIIEGTQGFGLSLLHAKDYPKTTSRDTTAGAFVSEVGLSPLDVSEIVLVTRAFPIRVPGESGPLPNEIDWGTIGREGGWEPAPIEYTSVTRNARRVGRFDAAIVLEAINVNQPTKIILNHADYFDGASRENRTITQIVEKKVSHIETLLNRRFDLIGLGPDTLRPRGGDLRPDLGFA